MTDQRNQPFHIDVKFEMRDDGGLRAYCDAVPDFVLSHQDSDLVINEVPEVLGIMLSARLGCEIRLTPTVDVAEMLGLSSPSLPAFMCDRVYMGQPVTTC